MVSEIYHAEDRFIQEQEIVPNGDRLNEVTKIIEIHQKKRKENIKHFDTVWKQISGELKKDLVFNELQEGCDFVGNYGDGIKINKSDEYDFQFYFRLPHSEKLIVTPSDGGAEINIKDLLLGQPVSSLVQKKLGELADVEYYLIPARINTWVRKLLTTYISTSYSFEKDGNLFQLTHSKHGSAELLHITVNKNVKFAVNIYPCIKLHSNQHWISKRRLADDTSFWAAVTKKQKNAPRSFHCSYEKIERGMLGSLNQLRNALKLLMKIRDKDQLTPFKTHYLKTVCLLIVEEANVVAWSNADTKTALVTVFSKVLQFIKEETVPSFWDSTENLIESLMTRGKFKNRLIDALEQAFGKVVKDEIPWAFCNKNERRFYYDIPKPLSYRRGGGKHFVFRNVLHPIPKEIQQESSSTELYPSLYLK